MTQAFKTIYFPDHPSESSRKRNVKLAFGTMDKVLHDVIKPLSGQELRELMGFSSFPLLQQAASDQGLPLNTFCLRLLRQKIRVPVPEAQDRLPGIKEPLGLPIDPLQATFRGGKAEPLHDWFPYLEGYSPEFVTRVLMEYAPRAKHVLDPFAGSGTTPLAVSALGKRASYCEVNPLLQHLVSTKAMAATRPLKIREAMARELARWAKELPSAIALARADVALAGTYHNTFGDSQFFTEEVFEQVLRIRTVLDQLNCEHADIARLASIAVLASLVTASKLIRRGDLRYRTSDELGRGHKSLLDSIQGRAMTMAEDLRRLQPIMNGPWLVCEDARNLGRLPRLDIDAVITSPPYLNGTNYFRNTKMELWFLRCLASQEDLASYRYRAVTAGINDVTVNKPADIVNDVVGDLVRQMEISAYDMRIPLMVRMYFHDLAVVFDGLLQHLSKNAKLLIDIGDSAYGGIHVPTHQILADLLVAKGFTLEKIVSLRRRMSRGGIPLSQSLLVLTKATTRRARSPRDADRHQLVSFINWGQFKKALPHQHGECAKRNWGHPLHSLCSYQGKMKPSLASHLVRTFVPAGGTILDPFGGVGTIAFEAALQGKRAWSFDISPAAVHISAAKLGVPQRTEAEAVISGLETYLHGHSPTAAERDAVAKIRMNGPLGNYFHARTLSEIILSRRFFQETPPRSSSESLVFASLLHILHGNRPYALSRRSHPITPFSPTGPNEYRHLIPRLRDKVYRGLEVPLPPGFMPGTSLFQDATSWWPQDIGQLDAIITSPPFFDSTRFYMANWMRLWFAGWDAEDFRKQPLAFVDERQKLDFGIYEPVFRQARERLKPGGMMVMHVGKSSKCDMAAALSKIAERWFHVVDVFVESVSHCESHGIRDKGTVVQHAYLVLN
jgi:tRNA G10  N-methylase Trm11